MGRCIPPLSCGWLWRLVGQTCWFCGQTTLFIFVLSLLTVWTAKLAWGCCFSAWSLLLNELFVSSSLGHDTARNGKFVRTSLAQSSRFRLGTAFRVDRQHAYDEWRARQNDIRAPLSRTTSVDSEKGVNASSWKDVEKRAMSVSGPAWRSVGIGFLRTGRKRYVDPSEGDGARPLFYCFASPTDGQLERSASKAIPPPLWQNSCWNSYQLRKTSPLSSRSMALSSLFCITHLFWGEFEETFCWMVQIVAMVFFFLHILLPIHSPPLSIFYSAFSTSSALSTTVSTPRPSVSCWPLWNSSSSSSSSSSSFVEQMDVHLYYEEKHFFLFSSVEQVHTCL